MRKSILCITTFILLATATPLHARWIGEMQRDYSSRLEKKRISREGIEVQRDVREERRLNVKESRSRILPTENIVENPDQNFAVRASIRARRLNQSFRQGEGLRVPRTEAVKSLTTKAKMDVRMDARRRADIGSIFNVLVQYVANPSLEGADIIPTSSTEICKSNAIDCGELADLDDLIVGSELVGFPMDPAVDQNAIGTGYYVEKTTGPGLKLKAPLGNGGRGIIVEWKKP